MGNLRSSSNFCTSAEEPKFSVPPEDALPRFVAGRWRSPRLSGRQIGVIKKQFRERDEEWVDPRPWKQNQGRRPYRTLEQCKGHKWDLTKEAKEKKIRDNLATMPELIRKYHGEERERKIKTYDEEHWLYPHEIKRYQRKKAKRVAAKDDDDREVYTRTDQEANDEHNT